MFRRPTRVIVPFPSMTNLAAAEIWHTKPPAGYEALYFDRQNNSLMGGEGSYLEKRLQAGDYHTLLDYVEPKAYEFIVYGFPERTNRADLRRFLLGYSTTDQKVFRAFLKSTDGLAHVGGREALEHALIELDGVLRKLRENSGSDLEITLFSDHGNSYTRSQPIDVEGHLQRNGFRMDDKLEKEASVVIPGFGLVNYAALYTAPDRKRHVAEVLSRLEEVDVVAYQESGVIHLLSRKGRAQIHYRQESDSYRYLGLSGDPLKLAAIQAQLMKEGTMTAYGYIADRVWFEALAEHEFPDVVFRIHQAVNGLVQNKADVLVSFKPGYAYGNRLSESFNRLAPVFCLSRRPRCRAEPRFLHVNPPGDAAGNQSPRRDELLLSFGYPYLTERTAPEE